MTDSNNNLFFLLRLTPYQSYVLASNSDKYNIGRIVKRGGVVFVPYQSRGIFGFFKKILFGVNVDVIGQNKMLVTNQRNVKVFSNGYHYVKFGPYTYYADAYGRGINRSDFLRGICN